MVNVSFYKISNSQLSSLAIKEGQVIYVTDTKRLYLDSGVNTRIELASYDLTQDSSDNHILTFTRPDGTTSTYTIPDHIYTATNHIVIDNNNVISLDTDTQELLYGEDSVEVNQVVDATISNTINKSPVKLELEPNIYQNTTTGKNQMPYDIYDSSISRVKEMPNLVLTAGTYTLSFDLTSYELGTNTALVVNMNLQFPNSAKQDVVIISINNNTSLGRKSYTFTTAEDMISSTASNIRIPETYFNKNGAVRLENIQIESGSTPTDFEPYTGGIPSPNPDYPQDIEVVTGYNNIKVSNKNLYTSAFQIAVGSSLTSPSGYRVLTNNLNYRGFVLKVTPNEIYSISRLTLSSSRLRCGFTKVYPVHETPLYNYQENDSLLKIENIVVPSEMNYFVIYLSNAGEEPNDLQIEKNASATSYVTHQEQKYEINLGKNLIDSVEYNKGANGSGAVITTNTTYLGINDYVSCKPNTTYTVSFQHDNSNITLYACYKQQDGTFIERVSIGTTRTFTTPSNAYYCYLYLNGSGADFSTVGGWVQLEKGNKATTYAPYFEPIEYCKINNTYKDVFFKNSIGNIYYDSSLQKDKWYLKHNVGKAILNGSEDWGDRPNYDYCDRFVADRLFVDATIGSAATRRLYCNYFIGDISNATTYPYIRNNDGQCVVNYSTKGTTTLAQFKTWLSTHNTIVYYILATPTYELLNNTLQKQLDSVYYAAYYYGEQTNIVQDSENLPFLMDIVGYKENIDGMYNSLQTQINNIHYINTNEKGVANGIAELDENGLLLTSQLPSYVDDVLEYATSSAFPAAGESGKIYVALNTNLTYRWSGSAYVEISKSLALGTTSSTAYRGDYGNSAYTHAVTNKGSAFTSGMYKITTNAEGHVTAATAIAKTDITGLGIPGSDTKNTAGSTDTSNKIYLVGATSQATNPQTYSDNEVFTTSGVLQAKSFSVNGGAAIVYNSTDKCIEFNFS